MSHYAQNGGEVMPLPETSSVMPRPVPGEARQESPLSIPTEKMPTALSGGDRCEGEPISVDSPLPGVGTR